MLTTNCESELQDLMHHIDSMMSSKKRDWEHQIQSLQDRMDIKDKETMLHRATIDQKHKEIGHLRQQLETMEKSHRELVSCYEAQLSALKSELQKLKRDYDRLNKKHSKQSKDSERDKDRTNAELQDSMTQVTRLSSKLEEYKQRSKDWELQKRTFGKQIETLEAQRKAMTEKCEFIQSQSQTYQSQLNRRKQILDNTESSLKSQISQLEGQLKRANESQATQQTKVEKLKSSLDDAINHHKKAMDENEKLLADLKRSNNHARKLEEEKLQYEADLKTKEDLLRAIEQDGEAQAEEMGRMEQALAEKDRIIHSLGNIKNKEESEQVKLLRQSLQEAREDTRNCKRNEKKLREEVTKLQDHLRQAVEDCERTTDQLEKKKTQLQKIESGEVKRLKQEVNRLKESISIKQQSHDGELEGMRSEISKLTSELHEKSVSNSALTEQSGNMERQLRNESEIFEKKSAELQVANAQIEALRLENRHLRQTILQQAQSNAEKGHTQEHFRVVKSSYESTVSKLEQENRQLRDDVSSMREEMNDMEDKFEEQLRQALKDSESSAQEMRDIEDRRMLSIEESAQRRIKAMEQQMNSTIQRYEQEIKLLRMQKSRLEDQLDMDRNEINFRPNNDHEIDLHSIASEEDYHELRSNGIYAKHNGHYTGENRHYTSDSGHYTSENDHYVRENEHYPNENGHFDLPLMNGDNQNGNDNIDNSYSTILSSRPMSISESIQEPLDPDEASPRDTVAQRFLAAENQRARELELLIDSHIETLKKGTENTIKRHSKR